jgi:hypothetical protein
VSSAEPDDVATSFTETKTEDGDTKIIVNWRRLLNRVGTGIVWSVFFGVIAGVQSFFEAADALIRRVTTSVTTVIETAAGQSQVIEAAWGSATEIASASGIGGFVVGIVAAVGAWYVFSIGVSVLVE